MKNWQRVSIERRAFIHLKVPLSIDFRFMSAWHQRQPTKIIKGKAYDVSKAGLCLETEIDMRDGVLRFSETEGEEKLKVLPYLVSSEKEMNLEFKVPPERKRVVVRGSAVWYELNSEGSLCKLKMGVFFRYMPEATRDKWIEYMETQIPSTLDNNG